MQIPIKGSPRLFLSGGLPRLDRVHPLANGLVAAYLPGLAGGGVAFNLASNQNHLAPGSGGSPTNMTQEGPGSFCNVANSAYTVTATTEIQIPVTASLYWRGEKNGNPSNDTALFGTTQGGSPFFDTCFLNQAGSPGSVNLSWNSGGTQFTGAGVAVFNGNDSIVSIGGTIDKNSNGITYNNGKQADSTAFGGSSNMTYSSAKLVLGGTWSGDTTRFGRSRSLCAYIWNRILSPTEMLALHNDPYGMFIFPEDDIAAELVGIVAAAAGAGEHVPSIFRMQYSGWR